MLDREVEPALNAVAATFTNPCRPQRISTAINTRTEFIEQARVSVMARGQSLHRNFMEN